MSGSASSTRLTQHVACVGGRSVRYLAAGSGPVVVFLHGWALTYASYRRALQGIADAGCRVLAPALPGFGGTADLPETSQSIAAYGRWVIDFLDAVDEHDPVMLIDHSFGGGVGICAAHQAPTRISRLVLINSVGGTPFSPGTGVVQAIASRPPWDWGLHSRMDVLPWRQLTRVLPVLAQDVVGNVLQSPQAFWRVARLACVADLRVELVELHRRGLPIVVIWGRGDHVIPRAARAAMHLALGDGDVRTVSGDHNWLINDPRSFTEVITNVLGLGQSDPLSAADPAVA